MGRWTLFALAPGWHRYQVCDDGDYGDDIALPEPFGFTIPTGKWPRWK
ncbi:hypothetical protein [Nocardia wallacei]|nr:hypothetical protein [Nocardia wallacei]